jgi:hypothetical protein
MNTGHPYAYKPASREALHDSERRVAARAAELTGIEREQFLWRAENAKKRGTLLCACRNNWHAADYEYCAQCEGTIIARGGKVLPGYVGGQL